MLGGSKVCDKLGVIAHLLPRVDSLLIGGGMLFTFLAAQGHKVGASLLEADQLDTVKGYIAEAEERGVEIVLPTDVVVAASFSADAEHVVAAGRCDRGDAVRRIRPRTRHRPRHGGAFAERIRDSKTVFWNGPMGVFELAPFAAGTKAVAAGAHRGRRTQRRRRRRLGRGRAPARIRRRPSSVTSRRAAAPASSSSRARSSPDWRSSDGSEARPRSSRATGR